MNLKEIEIEGKKIYLKKSGDSYRVVHPYKNEDGTINWFNVWTGGSWANLIIIIFFTLILVGLLHEYASNVKKLISCFDDPLKFEQCKQEYGNSTLNLNLGGDYNEKESLSLNLSLRP